MGDTTRIPSANRVAEDWRSDPMLRNVSKTIVQPMLRYLDDKYGRQITEAILADIGLDRDFFDDAHGFMPIETTEKMFRGAERLTGDTEFAYHIGRELWRYMPALQALTGTMVATPALLFENMGRIEGRAVRTTVVETEKISRSRYRLKVSFKGGFVEPPSACRNRHGTYESVSEIFGQPPAKVDHPQCRFKGDPECVYEVTLPESFPFLLQKAAIVAAGVSLVSLAVFAFVRTPWILAISAAGLPLALCSYLGFLRLRLNGNLRWIRSARKSLEENNASLRNEMERTRYLHELTVLLNKCLSTEDVAKATVEALVHDFHYESAQLWVTTDSDTLRCVATAGLDPAIGEAVRKETYSIAEGMKHADSFVAHVFGRQAMLLINDVSSATQGFVARTRTMISRLNPSSFIIIPLLDGHRAIGMLVGANHTAGKKVKYLDRLLFEALTQVVSNSLSKARLFEGMERKIEKRRQVLQERQEELLLARQMSIQSEKLSALGAMAAGVAHEINNPLNFLVNIVGDLEQDAKGLREILNVASTSLTGDARVEFERLRVNYTLDERMGEIDYVYSLIRKSLDKAKKTISSLRVFARSAGNEQLTDESITEIVTEAFDIIPQKYRSDVVVRMEGCDGVVVHVNRIEFSQVFISLLSNAIEAMEAKGTISLSCRDLGKEIEVRVTDTGPGVPAEIAGAIFRPFFTTKKRDQHVGLGLTIAREVARKYGGDVALVPSASGACCAVTMLKRQVQQ